MQLKGFKNNFNRIEPWVFLAVALFNLLPILSGKFFPTLDGAAHLYNANIIKELFLHPDGAFANYFEFNQSLVPNWTGHLILAILLCFFPAFIAEKCLLILFLIGLPYAFRALVKKLNPTNLLNSYFIFPFCYSAVFLFGFYNFSIGILLMFLTLNAWLKWEKQKFSLKKFAFFTLLFILLYFSHLVVFSITIGLLMGKGIYLLGYNYFNRSKIKSSFLIPFLKESGFLLLTALMPIILLIRYFLNRNVFTSSTQLSKEKLIEGLTDMESLIGFSYDLEQKYTFYIFCSILILLLFILTKRVFSFDRQEKLIQQDDYLLFAAIGVLALYFFLPNESGTAGFVSIRLNLIFYLILICWIALQQVKKLILGLLVLLALYGNFMLTDYYYTVSRDLNQYANSISECSKYIESEKTVIPLDYSGNWLAGHFSNYLGIDKNIIVLDNYESTVDYFPLTWSGESFPNMTIGDRPLENQLCIKWLSNPYGHIQQTDYVFVLGNDGQEGCFETIHTELASSYQLIYTNNRVGLYKRDD